MNYIDIPSFYSQWDGDNGGYRGTCMETCFKMIDKYLTGREVSIKDIVDNGDGDGSITTIEGAKKAAKWLGFGVESYESIKVSDIRKWLDSGRLLVAIIQYGLIPEKYKQDKGYQGGHAILITAIDSNNTIRYADPDFWGERRNEGWMNNNKWISWKDIESAWRSFNFLGVVSIKSKKPQVSPEEIKLKECSKKLDTCLSSLENRENTVTVLNKQLEEQKDINKDKSKIIEKLKEEASEVTERYNVLLDKCFEIENNNDKLSKNNKNLISENKKYNAEIEILNVRVANLNKTVEKYENNLGETEEMEGLLVKLFRKLTNIFKRSQEG